MAETRVISVAVAPQVAWFSRRAACFWAVVSGSGLGVVGGISKVEAVA